MSVEQLCMIAMVLMFGGFLFGVWHEASRWMRETNERDGWDSSFDTRDMEVAYSAVLTRLTARARLHQMRTEHHHPLLQMGNDGIPDAALLSGSQAAPPSHFVYGVQSMGDTGTIRLQKNQDQPAACYARSTAYHN
jgi:hypothetical protein